MRGGEDPNGPGFKYDPKHQQLSSIPKMPNLIFGKAPNKKKKQSLLLLTSTPDNLGPNAYLPNHKYRSDKITKPSASIGKGPRFYSQSGLIKNNETYIQYSAFGNQNLSKKQTEQSTSMGKASRCGPSGLMPKTHFKVSLPHAKY